MRLDFTNTTEVELRALSEYCDPATFGRDKEDILDETYRKAGKLDTQHFATNFAPHGCGLLANLEDTLLEGHSKETSLYCELYKLNVYGPGSFFKVHKDTPRGDNMFASLVVILPTEHIGGELVFRKGQDEFKFDSSKAVSEGPKPCVAFAAFFSDVDHEVLEVQSGYRVTLTWNIYFSDRSARPDRSASMTNAFENTLRAAMQGLLSDEKFLPRGGRLGFGLRHEYPIKNVTYREARDSRFKFQSIEHLLSILKGSDAILHKVCAELNLRIKLYMLYDDTDESPVLCPGVPYVGDHEYQDGLLYELRSIGARTLRSGSDRGDVKVNWITKVKPAHLGFRTTPYIAYGNNAVLTEVYSAPVLVVGMGPPGNRAVVTSLSSEENEGQEQEAEASNVETLDDTPHVSA